MDVCVMASSDEPKEWGSTSAGSLRCCDSKIDCNRDGFLQTVADVRAVKRALTSVPMGISGRSSTSTNESRMRY